MHFVCLQGIRTFVQSLPTVFEHNSSASNALGSALTAAYDLIVSAFTTQRLLLHITDGDFQKDFGGRLTVIQTVLPDVGQGALKSREDPNLRASNVQYLVFKRVSSHSRRCLAVKLVNKRVPRRSLIGQSYYLANKRNSDNYVTIP